MSDWEGCSEQIMHDCELTKLMSIQDGRVVAAVLHRLPARGRHHRALGAPAQRYVSDVRILAPFPPAGVHSDTDLSVVCHVSCWLGVLLKAEWVPGQGCAITDTRNKVLAATFIYTMCFDFIVLVLTGIKLGITTAGSRKDRSRIVRLIFDDGLIFFIVA